MPLRDHFRSPLDDIASWDALHGGWPMVIVQQLAETLPAGFVAAPRVHLGQSAEIDVATFDVSGREDSHLPDAPTTTSRWEPPPLTMTAELPHPDEYEVLVYDQRRGRRLVAAVEIVSPTNKDRPQHRGLFVAKCAALLREQVSVAIVDVVTTRRSSLWCALLASLGDSGRLMESAIYAAACRLVEQNGEPILEAWPHELSIGKPLPKLPLWIGADQVVPLDLEASYEATCRALRIS